MIDLGLKPSDITGLQLQAEKMYTLKEPSKQLRKLVEEENYLSQEDWEWLVGELNDDHNVKKGGKTVKYIANRIELNALGAKGLLDYLDERMEKLGIREKVCPDKKELDDITTEKIHGQLYGELSGIITSMVGVSEFTDWACKEIMKEFNLGENDFHEGIMEKLAQYPTENWDAILDRLVERKLTTGEIRKRMNHVVRKKVVERVEELLEEVEI